MPTARAAGVLGKFEQALVNEQHPIRAVRGALPGGTNMTQLRHAGLVLRPFEDRDASVFTEAVLESVGTVGRWMPWCHAGYTERDALAWFAAANAGALTGGAYEFGVFLDGRDGESTFVGSAGLNQINRQHAVCNLGYWVRRSMLRQGVASRCVDALSRHAFDTLDLRRVEIVVAVGNVASEAVARKSGALFECIARNRLLIRDASVPASVFSLVP